MLDSVEGWSSRKVSVMSRMQHMVNLSADDRVALRAFTAMGAHAARAHTRARILLLTDRHARGPRRTDRGVAEAVGCSERTVARVRAEWVSGDGPRSIPAPGP